MPAYLVRYGLMSRVGRFTSTLGDLTRGRTVVLRTDRGTELGEVLVPVPSTADEAEAAPSTDRSGLLRAASPEDLELARQAEDDRRRRFDLCQRIVQESDWPLELLDAEPLLDEGRTVLHLLAAPDTELSGLISSLRAASNLDVILEAIGREAAEDLSTEDEPSHGCGSCGTSGGGCSSGGCGSGGGKSHGGCSSCGVKKRIAANRSGSSR